MSQFTKLKEQCPSCNADASEDFICLHSGVTQERGFVHLAWSGNRAQFTPDEARTHAMRLLEAAEAAESDYMVLRLLRDRIGLDLPRAVQVIGDLRNFRMTK